MIEGTRVRYSAPRVLSRFLDSDAFLRCVVGPVGSGKTSACVMEILLRAAAQRPGPDGIRRSRFAVIRNTYGQLRDTTRKTFEQWIGQYMGAWREQQFSFHLRRGDVDCEVMFRALDTPDDVRKLLSLELTGAYVNEAREIPKHVLDVLETRVGRYPSKAQGGASWFGIWMDTNPWHAGHWGAKLFAKQLPGHALFRQPGGRSETAENVENLPEGYYARLVAGKDSEWLRVYVDGEDASGDVGAVFAAWLDALSERGGICAFDHPRTDVLTTWDLGRSDSTGIWFWRVNHLGLVDVLDHYENAGQGLSHYFGVIDGKGYEYAHHFLPHDAKAKTLATQQTVLEQCRERFGAGRVDLVPDIGLDDGISAARWLLEQQIQFHERCGEPGRLGYSGIDALREYRYAWDEKTQSFGREPVHNWASHTADAWRYVAVVVKFVMRMMAKPSSKPTGPYAKPVDRSMTLERLYAEQPEESERI